MKSSISLKVVCCILNILTHHRSLPRPPAAKEQKQNCRRPLITHSLCPITSNSLPHAPSKKAYSVLSPTIYSLIIVHYPAPPRRRSKNRIVEDYSSLIIYVLLRVIVCLMHRAKKHIQFFPRPLYCLLLRSIYIYYDTAVRYHSPV